MASDGGAHPGPEGSLVTSMELYLSAHSIVIATAEQVSCSLGDESAILNLKNTVYYGLDPIGSRIWDLMQKPISVAELRDALLEEYLVEAGRCERDLLDLLAKLHAEGLIELRGWVAA
jgi:hypothetical protein